AGRSDQPGDDDHGQREHDDLVDAGHDRRQGERQLDLAQDLARGGTERLGRLDGFAVDLADAELGEPYRGRDREDHGGDDPGHGTDPEEEHRGDQVDEHRQRLHEVQDRPGYRPDQRPPRGPDAERDADQRGDQGRYDDHAEGLHGLRPQSHRVDEQEGQDREDGQARAAGKERPDREDHDHGPHGQAERSADPV